MLFNDAIKKLLLRLRTIREDLPLDQAEVSRLQGTYQISPPNPSAARKQILIQDAKAILAVDVNHKIKQFILPTFVAIGAFYASLGDDLQECAPVTLEAVNLGKFVLTVSRLADVLEAGFGQLSELTKAPGNTNGPDGQAASETLAFPADIGGTQVFAPIPTVLPLGRTDKFPSDGIDLTKTLDATVLETLPAHVRAYVIGMWWLGQHNDLKSLHEHESAFKKDEIPITTFTDAGLDFATEAATEWSTASLSDNNTSEYKKRFRMMKRQLAQAIYEANPAAYEDDTESSSQGHNGTTNDTAVATAVAAAVAGVFTKNKKESEATDNAKLAEIKAFYQIFGAKNPKILQEGGGSIETLVPAQLGDAFLEVLSEPKASEAVRLLHRRWSEMTETFDRAPVWQFLYRYDIEIWQNVHVASLKNCIWPNRSFDLHPHDAKTKLSIFAFGPPNLHDPRFKEHKKANDLCNMEEAIGEDKTKQTKKKTELYLPRFSNTFGDLKIMFANIIVFWAFVTGDYTLSDPPLIVKIFINAIKMISDDKASGFEDHLGPKHLPISIALGMNRVLQCFVGAARNSKNIQALKAGSLQDPLVLASGIDVFNRLHKQVDQCFWSATFGDFRDVPPFAKYICGDCTPPSPDESDKRDSPSQDSKKNESPPKRAKLDKKEMGVFSKTGQKKPEGPPFKVKGTDGKERTFCMNFALVGRECKRGNLCDLTHLTKRQLATHPQREQINKYVRNNSDLKYTDGVELPPG